MEATRPRVKQGNPGRIAHGVALREDLQGDRRSGAVKFFGAAEVFVRQSPQPANTVAPPQIESAWPVMALAADEHRKATNLATSSASTNRPMGTAARAARSVSSKGFPAISAIEARRPRAISVSTQPGQTALHVI